MKRFERISRDKNNKLYGEHVHNLGQLSSCPKEDTGLAYDVETKVIYYMFEDYITSVSGRPSKLGFLAPYINENGKYCRFNVDTNQIEEIC